MSGSNQSDEEEGESKSKDWDALYKSQVSETPDEDPRESEDDENSE